MRDMVQFYINGEWVDPVTPNAMEVYNPASGDVCGQISLGSAEDVDKAVSAANIAFNSFSITSKEERIELLQSILTILIRRNKEIAEAIMEEMGAPWSLALNAQAESGPQQFKAIIEVLRNFEFQEMIGTTCVAKEAMVNGQWYDGSREEFIKIGTQVVRESGEQWPKITGNDNMFQDITFDIRRGGQQGGTLLARIGFSLHYLSVYNFMFRKSIMLFVFCF